jgi:cytosol alanyl aminopeptidase
MRARLVLLVLLVACAGLRPRADQVWRLPDDVTPLAYSVELTVDPRRDTFTGRIEIDLELGQALSGVRLHAAGLRITSAKLKMMELMPVYGGDIVELRAPLPLSETRSGRLVIEYSGTFSPSAQGLFRRHSSETGDWYAFSLMEPIAARRVFPCFDEPHHKVPWKITLVVPEGMGAYSNGPVVSDAPAGGGMHRVTFEPTPPMASYLVAVAVGSFDRYDANRMGFLVPRGTNPALIEAATVITPMLLEELEAYFKRPYPFAKLELLSIPRSTGAMEHPGLITFSSGIMLRDPENYDFFYENVAAHELAHQWFGNLVTMRWWDDLWLNESFATWMAARVVERFMDDERAAVAAAGERNEVMLDDGLPSVRVVRQPITSQHDIAGAFDSITYQKGAAILRMLEVWLGETKFRDAVRAYIAAHAGGSATSADFTAALSKAAGRDVGPVLHAFLDQPGVPLVSLKILCDGRPRAMLSVEPYVALGVPAPAQPRRWPVPICLRHEQGTTCALVEERTELALSVCPAWIAPNAGASGYYRVVFDASTIDAEKLTLDERVDLVGNTAALVRAGRLPVDDALDLLANLAPDHILDELATAIDEISAGDDAVRGRAVARIIAPAVRAIGWEDEHLAPRAFYDTVAFAKDVQLTARAMAFMNDWLDGGKTPSDLVLRAAAQAGDRKLFDRLLSRLQLAKDPVERARILGVIGALRDPALAELARGLVLKLPLPAEERVAILYAQHAQGHEDLRAALYRFLEKNAASVPGAALLYFASGQCSRAHAQAIKKRFGPISERQLNGPRRLARVVEETERCAGYREAQN